MVLQPLQPGYLPGTPYVTHPVDSEAAYFLFVCLFVYLRFDRSYFPTKLVRGLTLNNLLDKKIMVKVMVTLATPSPPRHVRVPSF